MTYTRISAIWTGATGLPGYTRLKFDGTLDAAGALAAATRVRTFFEAIKSLIPVAISINYAEAAQVYGTDQVLLSEVGFVPPAVTVGTGAGSFSSPSGMVVNWLTSAVFAGRKLRGRSFLVPLVGATYAADGTPSPTAMTAVTNAAAALVSGSPALVVAGSHATAGFIQSAVTGSSVPDRAAVLRSRRD